MRAGPAVMDGRACSALMRKGAITCLAFVAFAFGALWPAPPGRAAELDARAAGSAPRAADWTAIKAVIANQRNALKTGDAAKAFSYASPGIRDQFENATAFIAMVRAAYSALITARYTEFLDGAVIDGAVIQPLRLIDTDNTVRVALYIMERQRDGTWRISGCRIAPSTVQAT
jgi:Domain of unknown function (DUF4864)